MIASEENGYPICIRCESRETECIWQKSVILNRLGGVRKKTKCCNACRKDRAQCTIPDTAQPTGKRGREDDETEPGPSKRKKKAVILSSSDESSSESSEDQGTEPGPSKGKQRAVEDDDLWGSQSGEFEDPGVGLEDEVLGPQIDLHGARDASTLGVSTPQVEEPSMLAGLIANIVEATVAQGVIQDDKTTAFHEALFRKLDTIIEGLRAVESKLDDQKNAWVQENRGR